MSPTKKCACTRAVTKSPVGRYRPTHCAGSTGRPRVHAFTRTYCITHTVVIRRRFQRGPQVCGHPIMANPQSPRVPSSCLALLEENNHGHTMSSCCWSPGYVLWMPHLSFSMQPAHLASGRLSPKETTRSSSCHTDTSVERTRRAPARTAASPFVSRSGWPWPTKVPLPPVKKRAQFGGANRDGDA